MAIRKYKPTTPGRRGSSVADFVEVTRTTPETDWRGNFVLSSQVWTTARDLARLGLLYQITRALSAEGLDIASARIATEIDQALDTFYVHGHDGRKLDEPAGTARIRASLEQALTQPL